MNDSSVAEPIGCPTSRAERNKLTAQNNAAHNAAAHALQVAAACAAWRDYWGPLCLLVKQAERNMRLVKPRALPSHATPVRGRPTPALIVAIVSAYGEEISRSTARNYLRLGISPEDVGGAGMDSEKWLEYLAYLIARGKRVPARARLNLPRGWGKAC